MSIITFSRSKFIYLQCKGLTTDIPAWEIRYFLRWIACTAKAYSYLLLDLYKLSTYNRSHPEDNTSAKLEPEVHLSCHCLEESWMSFPLHFVGESENHDDWHSTPWGIPSVQGVSPRKPSAIFTQLEQCQLYIGWHFLNLEVFRFCF